MPECKLLSAPDTDRSVEYSEHREESLEVDKMQTVSGRVRVRVVPLGGVYTFAPAQLIDDSRRVSDESTSSRSSRKDGQTLRRIERKRANTDA